jgi:hypothetical protein
MAHVTAKTIRAGDIVASPLFNNGRTTSSDLIELCQDYLKGFRDRLPILVGLLEPLEIKDLTVELDSPGDGTNAMARTHLHSKFLDRSWSLREFQSYLVLSATEEWRSHWEFDPDQNDEDFGVVVTARRLADDGLWDPEGELIQFWMIGPFQETIPEVRLLGRVDLESFCDNPSPLNDKDALDSRW